MGRSPNIIVCGDIMLDHNVYTTIEKLANEAPIPVFNKTRDDYQLGGCGNVLKNLAALGCAKLYAFSVIGNDVNGRHIESILNTLHIKNNITTLDGYNTVTKQRFLCENKIIFRSDTENDVSTHKILQSISFVNSIETLLQNETIDCIILSDYNKGVLYKKQCQDIITIANKYNVFTCVDPKNDYTKYVGCTLIKPNRREAYDIFKFDKTRSLEELHKHIYETVNCKYSVITLAEKGITLYNGNEYIREAPTIHTIIDVTGAGDIVCCILGYFIPTGMPLQKVLKLATHIATKSIECPGTYTIQPSDIHTPSGKCITVDQLKYIRNTHDHIVFTNGCFDLIHSGHIQLLKFCKEKGTVVVGLNSDASIRRLKGPTRPVHNLQTRLDILESIQYIDYIVVFEEDTPYTIVKDLAPDYLVKGGDYNIDTVIGREFAKETLLCNFVQGSSSTSIIHRIQHPRKTLIHVWTHAISNQQVTDTSWRFGIGDLIRGSIGMLQYCEAHNYECIIDISLHPISQHLVVKPHTYSKLIQENKNNIKSILPQAVGSYIKDAFRTNDVIYLFCNCGTDVLDIPPSRFVLDTIHTLLTPNAQFAEYSERMMRTIPFSEFTIIHFRLGDEDLIQGILDIDYIQYVNMLTSILNDTKEENQILLSDSERFKKVVRSKCPIFMFNESVAHLGFHTDMTQIQHTIFEFMLLSKAKSIKTYSVYGWTSGFAKIVNYLYNVPLIIHTR